MWYIIVPHNTQSVVVKKGKTRETESIRIERQAGFKLCGGMVLAVQSCTIIRETTTSTTQTAAAKKQEKKVASLPNTTNTTHKVLLWLGGE